MIKSEGVAKLAHPRFYILTHLLFYAPQLILVEPDKVQCA
ncbi:hypothetical protein HMPREF3218_0201750 [Prevotella bivia]|nr:hypothetical protein HMPREF3218_0201750 [Prevotella bivia]